MACYWKSDKILNRSDRVNGVHGWQTQLYAHFNKLRMNKYSKKIENDFYSASENSQYFHHFITKKASRYCYIMHTHNVYIYIHYKIMFNISTYIHILYVNVYIYITQSSVIIYAYLCNHPFYGLTISLSKN